MSAEKKEKKFLVIIPHYWGKGDTVEEAIIEVRKAGGKYKKSYAAHYLVGPETTVNELGSIMYMPDDGEPELIHKGSKLK